MNIGFIGLGRMGKPMAARLLEAGHHLSVHDINPVAAAALVERGARSCGVAELAAASEVILTCLPGPAEVDTALRGAGGVVENALAGSLVIETSTIGPKQSRNLAAEAAVRGLAYIDAPVSNGEAAAAAGTLTIMAGGAKRDFDRATPVLKSLATNLFHMGDVGAGSTAKLINQAIYLTYVASFCEAARLARDAGLDMAALVEVLRQSVAGSPLTTTGWAERILSGDLKPGFSLARVLKDLGLVREMCADETFTAPMLQLAYDTFRTAGEAGAMDKDMTALYAAR